MKVICFDLDDTLYKEIDFLTSAFDEIVEYSLAMLHSSYLNHSELLLGMLDAYYSKNDAFDYLINATKVNLDKATLLSIYRNHIPKIHLLPGASELLNEIKYRKFEIGIITDGRSIQQRNKLDSLDLDTFVKDKNIIISEEFGLEKPSRANYEYFVGLYPDSNEFCYIADNTQKDFLSPNALGWKTICLQDDGRNIHYQRFDLPKEYLPQYVVKSLEEVIDLL